MQNSFKKYAHNTLWVGIATIVRAIIGFISVPLILGYFSKEHYALIILATSLNVYLNIVNLGIPTGVVKHTAAWLGKGNMNELSQAARSSFLFYMVVGFINFLVLLFLGVYSDKFFNINVSLYPDFFSIILITAISILIFWPFSIFNQLLQGAEEIAWLNRINIMSDLLRLSIIMLTIKFRLNIVIFYLLITLTQGLPIPFKMMKWGKYLSIRQTMLPGWYWKTYKKVLLFSLGLFIIGAANVSLIELRPIILANRADLIAVTEYKILFTITNFVFIISTLSQSSLLPLISRADALGDDKTINAVIFKVTKYSWTLVAPLIFGIAITSKQILSIYVGEEYIHLWPWLVIWVNSLFQIYLGTVSSVFIGRGKIRFLIYAIPVNVVLSLITVWYLAPILNVGAVAVGHFVFSICQIIIYHGYFLPKVLLISPKKMVFECFVPPFIASFIMGFVTFILFNFVIEIHNSVWQFSVTALFCITLYSFLVLAIVIKPMEFKKLWMIIAK